SFLYSFRQDVRRDRDIAKIAKIANIAQIQRAQASVRKAYAGLQCWQSWQCWQCTDRAHTPSLPRVASARLDGAFAVLELHLDRVPPGGLHVLRGIGQHIPAAELPHDTSERVA